MEAAPTLVSLEGTGRVSSENERGVGFAVAEGEAGR